MSSYVPTPDRPRSVPAIKDFLLSTMELVRKAGGDYGELMTYWESRTLAHPDTRMIWVHPEMMELLVEVADTIPDDMDLSEVARPLKGFAVFGQPLFGIDATGRGEQVRMDGLIWGPISVQTHEGVGRHGMSIATVARIVTDDTYKDGWFPLGRSEWMDDEKLNVVERDDIKMNGKDWLPVLRTETYQEDEKVPFAETKPRDFDQESKDHYYMSCIEDRKLIAALFGLMAQERHVEIGTWRPKNKAARRRHGDISIATVTLRRSRLSDGTGTGTGTGSTLDHRTYVAPYFRMQPYGPGRSLRRLQLIDGHIRGPEDAPLITRKKVWSLRK